MVRRVWKIYVALVLVGASLLLGLAHVAIFRNPHDLLFYLTLDIVCVPIQVLLVTFIIERLLAEREKQMLLHKLNMVIGAFFGEVGTRLLRDINRFCPDNNELADNLCVTSEWTGKDYNHAAQFSRSKEFRLAPDANQLSALRDFLLQKRGFLLALLENPNLLEHETFTDLLWAVSHMSEELEARTDLTALPAPDIAHLQNDIRRALGMLIREWLAYMQHLKTDYPYIYSLGLRTNPFNPQCSVVVKE